MSKSKRLSVVCWNDGYRHILGLNWGGNYRNISIRLNDMIANGEMRKDAFLVRLPRRFVMDFRGRIYKSIQDQRQSILDGITYGYGHNDLAIC